VVFLLASLTESASVTATIVTFPYGIVKRKISPGRKSSTTSLAFDHNGENTFPGETFRTSVYYNQIVTYLAPVVKRNYLVWPVVILPIFSQVLPPSAPLMIIRAGGIYGMRLTYCPNNIVCSRVGAKSIRFS
jgi:hypothetical protein